MDGIFKMYSFQNLYQFYIIYNSVNAKENSRILPLVYILINEKSKELYQILF
jgi:DNA topoisomerase VI subunit B